MPDFSNTDIAPDAATVATRVAAWLIARIAAQDGPVRIALSGGTTPKALFAVLAQPQTIGRIDWPRVHLFWGDERFVPYDSADSNYGEAARIMLDKLPAAPGGVHPFPVDGPPEAAAARYAALLQAEYGAATLDPARPLFDVNFLGLGEDGHTASLIPGQPVLRERTAWAAAVGQGRPEVRLTLTYPVLESASTVAFLVAGAGKQPIVRQLRTAPANYPAGNLHPTGQTIWFMDTAAAG